MPALQREKSEDYLQDGGTSGWGTHLGDMQCGELPHVKELIVDLSSPP